MLASDQEGAVVSELLSRACDAYDMERDLAGSEGHTRTGVAERRLGVVKVGALKLYAQVQRQGLETKTSNQAGVTDPSPIGLFEA